MGVSRRFFNHTSPISRGGSALPSASVICTLPGTGRPTDPRWASHSTPLITVAAGSNIIFQEFSAPNTGLRRVKLRPLLPGTDNGAITVALTDPLVSGFGDVRITVRGFVGSVLS